MPKNVICWKKILFSCKQSVHNTVLLIGTAYMFITKLEANFWGVGGLQVA